MLLWDEEFRFRLGTAAVSSGGGALAAALCGGDVAGGADLVSVAAGLLVLFGFEGISTCNAITTSLWSQICNNRKFVKMP